MHVFYDGLVANKLFIAYIPALLTTQNFLFSVNFAIVLLQKSHVLVAACAAIIPYCYVCIYSLRNRIKTI